MKTERKYRTVKTTTEGVYREKGSRFFAFAIPCDDSDMAKKHIDELWKKNPGAVHVCYAWRFGKINFSERFSDDGEPSNSAGKPIFGQIVSYDLTNILIAVVRYYGGTNLGVGGLIQAYKSAADDALSKAEIIENDLLDYFRISFDFTSTGDVMNLLTSQRASINSQHHHEKGTILEISVAQSKSDLFLNLFQPLHTVEILKTESDQ